MELLASRIFCDLLYKWNWRHFYLVILSTVWKETHAYSLKWRTLRYIHDLPNRQIKATSTAKYTTYMVVHTAQFKLNSHMGALAKSLWVNILQVHYKLQNLKLYIVYKNIYITYVIH